MEGPNTQLPVYASQQPGQNAMGNQYQNAGFHPEKVRDYLPWSILNLLIGFLIGGIIAIVLSILVRNRVKENNIPKAKTLSIVTLIWNLIVTLGGLAIWAYIIYVIVVAIIATTRVVSAVNSVG